MTNVKARDRQAADRIIREHRELWRPSPWRSEYGFWPALWLRLTSPRWLVRRRLVRSIESGHIVPAGYPYPGRLSLWDLDDWTASDDSRPWRGHRT